MISSVKKNPTQTTKTPTKPPKQAQQLTRANTQNNVGYLEEKVGTVVAQVLQIR